MLLLMAGIHLVRQANFEVLKVSGGSRSNRLTVVLPGNPGIVDYYFDMASDISTMCDCDVVVLGYLGFLREPKWYALPSFDLETQITHSQRQLEELIHGYEWIGIAGHSIGALVALACLRPQINAVAALMPFVAANDCDKEYAFKRRLARLPGAAKALALVGCILRIFPSSLRAMLMGLAGFPTDHMSPRARALTVDAMTRPANLHQYVAMGSSEFASRRILDGPDVSWLETHRAKVGFVYATEHDCWVRPGDPSSLADCGVETTFVQSKHDFPTRVDSSRVCATAIHAIFKARGLN